MDDIQPKGKLPEDVEINPGEGLAELQQHITFCLQTKKKPLEYHGHRIELNAEWEVHKAIPSTKTGSALLQ